MYVMSVKMSEPNEYPSNCEVQFGNKVLNTWKYSWKSNLFLIMRGVWPEPCDIETCYVSVDLNV